MCKCQSLLYIPNMIKENLVKNTISFMLAPPKIKKINKYKSNKICTRSKWGNYKSMINQKITKNEYILYAWIK